MGSVTGDLDHVFTGIRTGCPEKAYHHIIDQLTLMYHVSQVYGIGWQAGNILFVSLKTYQFAGYFVGILTGKPHHGYGTAPGRCGNGAYGCIIEHFHGWNS
jgi:hypothetical protein